MAYPVRNPLETKVLPARTTRRPELLSPPEAADLIQVSVTSLLRLLEQGLIPHANRPDGTVVVPLAALLAWSAERADLARTPPGLAAGPPAGRPQSPAG